MGVIVAARRNVSVSPRLYGPIAVLVGLLLWEFVGRYFDPLLFAPPSAVVQAWVGLVESGELPRAASVSLLALAMGFGTAIVVGLAIGMVMGLYQPAKHVLDIYVNTLMAAPMIALLPIIVLGFGLEVPGRAVIIFLFAVFTIIVNTEVGMSSINAQYLEMARSFGLDRKQILLEIRLPNALPGIVAGMRVALIRAISGMVVAELFLALTGIGFLLRVYGKSFKTPELFAVILTVVIAAVLASGFLNRLARRFSQWQRGMRWE